MTTPTPRTIADLDRPLPELVAAIRASRPRYQPSPQEQARQAAAVEHLAQVAAKAGLTPEDVLKAGIEAERRHEVLDLDADSTCPFEGAFRYPYLIPGGQS